MTHWTPPAGTRGLIFDCDGTLADTMPVHFKAWTAMMTRHGLTLPEARFYELGGVPTAQIIRIRSAETGVPVTDVPGMTTEKENLFLDLLAEVVPVRPVFRIAVEHRGRMPMAVASGGYRRTIELTLHHLGVRDWFDAVVTAEDTERHKPEPDVFLEAARRLGLPAAECVVFEDTDIGLEAARRAGAVPVDVRPWLRM